jgi:hypothetical protein
VEYEEETSETE